MTPGGGSARLFRLPPWMPAGTSDPARAQRLAALSEATFRTRLVEDPRLPAGYTYFGQFVAHDLTMAASHARLAADPDRPPSTVARARLDVVYGHGPELQPVLYVQTAHPRGRGRLAVGDNGEAVARSGGTATVVEADVLRSPDRQYRHGSPASTNVERTAVLADPRNDETVLIAQMHLAVCRFHNARVAEGHTFVEAQRLTRWHYQWVLVHDYLPRITGAALVRDLLTTTPRASGLAACESSALPLEFSLAAFRFGHSMVRDAYHLNDVLQASRGGAPLQIVRTATPENSLHGGRVLPPAWSVQWDRFVSYAGSRPQLSAVIGPHLPRSLRDLPVVVPGDPPELPWTSLPFRTLFGGWQAGLPSGQEVAWAVRRVVPDLERLAVESEPEGDPLWLYVLKEAAAQRARHGFDPAHGALGPVGAWIVASVVLRAVATDPGSFLNAAPAWAPALAPGSARSGLADFLQQAGVPMTAGDWQTKRQAM